MNKQFRLSVKIAFGFSVLVVMLLALGLYAGIQFRAIQVSSQDVNEEAVPLVLNAVNTERQALKTITEDLRYQFTGNNRLVALITTNLNQAIGAIHDTASLATQHGLTNVGRAAELADEAAKQYADLLRQAGEHVEQATTSRKQLENTEDRYQKAITAIYTAEQHAAIKEVDEGLKQLDQTTTTNTVMSKEKLADNIRAHIKEIGTYRDIVDLSHEAYISMQQSDLRRDAAIAEAALANFDSINTKLDELKNTLDAGNAQNFEDCRKAVKEYRGAMENLIKEWKAQQETQKKCEEASGALLAQARAVAEQGITQVRNTGKTAIDIIGHAFFMLGVGVLLALVVGIAFSAALSRSITKPINRIIAGLSSGAEQVASASNQVASSSQQMAQGSSEQASSLEETSASLEEMASMTRQNADNSVKTDTLMSETKDMVQGSVTSMQNMSSAIGEIRQSAQEMAKIIKTIDEIAFQTNLLALNAAVEAARAGEAGKGFAVVAEEVRNLARRSAEAAKTTASLIEGAQKNTETGVQASAKVAEALTRIQAGALKVAALVAEIAAASRQQAQGIDQVNVAVSEMDKVIQQNAANAEESASAAEELSSQAQELYALVSELTALVSGQEATAAVVRRTMPKAGGPSTPTASLSDRVHGMLNPTVAHKSTRSTLSPEKVILLDEHELKQF